MAEAQEKVDIRPQPGPQEAFLSSRADICIYGGGAYGGKTYGLLLEPIRHKDNPRFGAVAFRRVTTEITNEGGLWDEARELYTPLGARFRETPRHQAVFPSGARVTFAHLQYEETKDDWRGAQIALSLWDQLETFTKAQFFYLLSRHRTNCGVLPYVRGTCNPEPDSWLAHFLEWWIDQKTGYAIPARSGTIRWMVNQEGQVIWADTREELVAKYGKDSHPLSVAFIAALYTDNVIGLQRNPNYVAYLDSLDPIERERLKHGNWKVRYSAGSMFKRHWFGIVPAAPANKKKVRMWDLAGTDPSENPESDETASARWSRSSLGLFFVEDAVHFRAGELEVERAIVNTAQQDGRNVTIGIFQDPGQAGKGQARRIARMLAGYDVKILPANKDTGKIVMAKPVSAQAEARNIYLVQGTWNDYWLTQHENFPEGKLKDLVDTSGGAFKILTERMGEWKTGEC